MGIFETINSPSLAVILWAIHDDNMYYVNISSIYLIAICITIIT